MKMKEIEIGICGLSCRLCPRYHATGKSRCPGCKSKFRIAAGCPFITCAIFRKGVEFCWDCEENKTCEKWKKHRSFSKRHDTFKCYQGLEENIALIEKKGIGSFKKEQKKREKLLNEMLKEFNEGRSKSYYCIAATVFKINELKTALIEAQRSANRKSKKEGSKILHGVLDKIAGHKNYYLKLKK